MSLRRPARFIYLLSFPDTSTAGSRDRPSAGVPLYVLHLNILNHLSDSREVLVSVLCHWRQTKLTFSLLQRATLTQHHHHCYSRACALVVGLIYLWSVE